MIDFTNCPVNRFRAYGGANGNKINISYEGSSYMLKFINYVGPVIGNHSGPGTLALFFLGSHR